MKALVGMLISIFEQLQLEAHLCTVASNHGLLLLQLVLLTQRQGPVVLCQGIVVLAVPVELIAFFLGSGDFLLYTHVQ